ncbi:hypothetical protein [Bradyrhizobium sp. USDA 4529]
MQRLLRQHLAILPICDIYKAEEQDFSGNDLRDIRIGGKVIDLPAAGYVDFSCPSDPNAKPATWLGWRDCPPGPDGLPELRFGYDPATSREGLIVAGHPAMPRLLIDKEGTIVGLRIETVPKARLYLRK